MKRENLKFRAWDTYLKKWVANDFHLFGETMAFDLIYQYCAENPNDKNKGVLLRMNDIEIDFYSSFDDLNKQSIYDGDIVEYEMYTSDTESEKGIAEVKFDGGCFCVDEWPIGYCNIKIIGNIYENVDLLKTQNGKN